MTFDTTNASGLSNDPPERGAVPSSNDVASQYASSTSVTDRARQTRAELASLGRLYTKMSMHIAGLLSEVQQGNYWRGDYSTFAQYVEKEVGIRPRTAQELLKVFHAAQKLRIPLEEIERLGWSKLAVVAGQLTEENKAELLRDVDRLTYSAGRGTGTFCSRPGGGQAHFAPQTPQNEPVPDEPVPDGFYRRIPFAITDDYLQLLRGFLRASLGESVSPHVETILTRGKNSFLYVRLLRDLLRLQIAEQGETALDNLQPGDLPAGDQVFPAYLDQLARDVSSRHDDPNLFAQWHRPVLLLIAAAYEPVTRDHLRRWLGPRDWDDRANHHLNLALDDLSPLLNTERGSVEGNFSS
ncbi:MAG: hypothetical protein O3C40_18795 [Planctomycetota bacterium]|nr:hypothetical protein [Planctomycetota bacterium]